MKAYPTYNITIIVAGVDEDGDEAAEANVKLGPVKRESIMREGYPEPIRNLVDMLERSIA